ncbi:MAG: hypothetical protein IPG45_34580 [Deltaproteobacteria bacterium]|nr:hypothetical protein [Deltaproteobacteria bacterium]
MGALDYIREVAKLPAQQREVLIPLIAWQLSRENPGFDLGPELNGVVDEFLASLGTERALMEDRLKKRLRDAGISEVLLRELQTAAKLPALKSALFEQRQRPGPGQVGGNLAAVNLRVRNR